VHLLSSLDVKRDVPIKKLRWGSEANFRRVDELACLHDTVPRSMFAQLHHAVDFAHGRQNAIGLPFNSPNDNYFQEEADNSDDDSDWAPLEEAESDDMDINDY
jgi:hypothetical protein